MGVFNFFIHRLGKMSIRKKITCYKNFHPDKRAGMIFYVWLIRGVNLAGTRRGVCVNIPLYYYPKNSERAIRDYMKGFKNSGNTSMYNAANHHLYTNLAVSFPDQGYGALVREMWRALFENHTDIKDVVKDMEPLLAQPLAEELIKNNDVTVEQLVSDPRSIMPHFLVPGHPLSARRLEEEKLGRYILGE